MRFANNILAIYLAARPLVVHSLKMSFKHQPVVCSTPCVIQWMLHEYNCKLISFVFPEFLQISVSKQFGLSSRCIICDYDDITCNCHPIFLQTQITFVLIRVYNVHIYSRVVGVFARLAIFLLCLIIARLQSKEHI